MVFTDSERLNHRQTRLQHEQGDLLWSIPLCQIVQVERTFRRESRLVEVVSVRRIWFRGEGIIMKVERSQRKIVRPLGESSTWNPLLAPAIDQDMG